jgi:hypothetical protein
LLLKSPNIFIVWWAVYKVMMEKTALLTRVKSQMSLFSKQRGTFELPEDDITLLADKWVEHHNRPVEKLVVQVPLTGPIIMREFSDAVHSEIPRSKEDDVKRIVDEIVSSAGGHIPHTNDDRVGKVVVVSVPARIAALRLKLLGIKKENLHSGCIDERKKTGAHELEIKLAYHLLPPINRNSKGVGLRR